jgi:hypothetical protein
VGTVDGSPDGANCGSIARARVGSATSAQKAQEATTNTSRLPLVGRPVCILLPFVGQCCEAQSNLSCETGRCQSQLLGFELPDGCALATCSHRERVSNCRLSVLGFARRSCGCGERFSYPRSRSPGPPGGSVGGGRNRPTARTRLMSFPVSSDVVSVSFVSFRRRTFMSFHIGSVAKSPPPVLASCRFLCHFHVVSQPSADGYILGTYRIATAPEPNSSRLTSFKSTRFDSPANNVGPWPTSLGCTTNSYSSINPSSRVYA